MITHKFNFLPPRPAQAQFDKAAGCLLRGLFPFLTSLWQTKPGWLSAYIDRLKFGFCQFASFILVRRFRQWLRIGAHYIFEKDASSMQIPVLKSALSYRFCFNCPPSSCCVGYRFKVKEVRVCHKQFCPHCHYRRALRLAMRAIRAIKVTKPYYQNMHLFRYVLKIKLKPSAEPDLNEMRAAAVAATAVAKKHISYLGSTWYICPLRRKNDSIQWQVRLLVIGGGSFNLDRKKVSPGLELVRAVPATAGNVFRQMGKALSWGKGAMWYSESVVAAWAAALANRKRLSMGSGCMYSYDSYRNPKVFARFKKHHRKKDKKFFSFSV